MINIESYPVVFVKDLVEKNASTSMCNGNVLHALEATFLLEKYLSKIRVRQLYEN
jgi:hypothetical protein